MGEVELDKVADLIRIRSRAGDLTADKDLREYVPGIVPSGAVEPGQGPSFIQEALRGQDDIKIVFDSKGGAFYYSEQYMTGAYANILVLKMEGRHRMMAEIIREHSRMYPRPVPIRLFRYPPFDLEENLISESLVEMMRQGPYRDISLLTTSIGNTFAYSADYLTPDYAQMLAEWNDVGLAQNP